MINILEECIFLVYYLSKCFQDFADDTMLGGAAAHPQRAVQPWEGPGQAGEKGREELAEVQ